MFDSEEFKEFFSQFFAEFSKFMGEFQQKAHIYGDLWQFLLTKAAKELGIINQDEDRVLRPEEINVLYQKAMSMMPNLQVPESPPSEEQEKEETLEKDLKPGKLPRPAWFNFDVPPEKKEG